MNLRPKKREPLDVDITPLNLIDIMLVLLLFFMMATTFDRHANLKVDLPEASTATQNQTNASIVIVIDAQSHYFINDRQLVNSQKETLKLALQKTLSDQKNVSLVLRADARTPHQAVVNAMDVAAQLGLTRLSIATLDKAAP